ncbi:ABC transporter ATP-binding protein/permease [Candidatus Saccharibacteria bacterium]|nr:ABC transporter ATP-binding protein/permease [Candidatus Saccharibacteria bacterium]
MLELKGVTKVYVVGGIKQKVLKNINLNFRENEFAAILGPSGSGKTTLLNIIGGLDKYNSGDLIINEKSTKKFRDKDWDSYRNHRVGFVFQSYNLIPHQTILQNVRLALTLSGISKRESIRRAKKALKDVGLEDHIDKRPNQLSGGQMQRVAIARALVNDPDILLADEPTGALDSETSLQIMDLLKQIADKKLVVMVTHNPELADKYATRIITLKDGEITSDSDSYDGKKKTDLDLIESERKSKKTKMSFATALGLSNNNLLTKKARTALVAAAGSIGIIGIALISAVSTGFQNYIDSIERDTLTSYPLMIQRESTNFTSILLSLTGNGEKAADGKIHENQVITSTLGDVTKNDLKSFRKYLDEHYSEVEDDIRLIENEYNIDPLIYTIDATDELAKLNPNSLFTTILGDTTLMSSYSNLTSVFKQYAEENIKEDTDIVAGRYPEKYNEIAVILSNPTEINDLLTYSLGLHDTDALNNIITKIMGGEPVTITHNPLTLEYDDILNLDLRLIMPSDTYQYNSKYNVYEDMSSNLNFMMDVYNNKSEKLKIVGIVTPKSDMLAIGNGVLYLPSLIEHIIEVSSKSEIVKKQLDNPKIDIFSNAKFGASNENYNFRFEDLVSVDESALSKAIGVDIDQNAISSKIQEYITSIGNDISVDTTPAKNALKEKLKAVIAATVAKYMALSPDERAELMDETKFLDFTKNSANEVGFDDLTSAYHVPGEIFVEPFGGLAASYFAVMASGTSVDDYVDSAQVATAFETFAVIMTDAKIKTEVLTAVGDLSKYLTSSFANAFHVDPAAITGAFRLNFSEDELQRVVSAMFTKKKSTLQTNLQILGYQALDDPTHISFYFTSFDAKTHFMEWLDDYNEKMSAAGKNNKVIEYSDTTGMLMSSVKTIVDAVSYVLIAFVSISLVVSSIMIGVITYISVYERKKEIGILRALGASKRNISNIFNAETFIIGLLSGVFAIVFSYLIIPIINLILHHFTGDIPLSATLAPTTAISLIILSVILTLIGGLIPARSASKKDPVEALRSE